MRLFGGVLGVGAVRVGRTIEMRTDHHAASWMT